MDLPEPVMFATVGVGTSFASGFCVYLGKKHAALGKPNSQVYAPLCVAAITFYMFTQDFESCIKSLFLFGIPLVALCLWSMCLFSLDPQNIGLLIMASAPIFSSWAGFSGMVGPFLVLLFYYSERDWSKRSEDSVHLMKKNYVLYFYFIAHVILSIIFFLIYFTKVYIAVVIIQAIAAALIFVKGITRIRLENVICLLITANDLIMLVFVYNINIKMYLLFIVLTFVSIFPIGYKLMKQWKSLFFETKNHKFKQTSSTTARMICTSNEKYSDFPIQVFKEKTTKLNVTSIKMNSEVEDIFICSFPTSSLITEIKGEFGKDFRMIVLPPKLEKISENAFIKAKSINRLEIDKSNQNFLIEDGCLYKKSPLELVYVICDKNELKIKEGVTKIWKNALRFAKIKEIQIPATVKVLDATFTDNENIEEVTFAENSQLEKIYNSAFSGTSLIKIELPSSLQIIGNKAFAGCNKLKTVVVPENTKLSICYKDSFADCKELEAIDCPKSAVGVFPKSLNHFVIESQK